MDFTLITDRLELPRKGAEKNREPGVHVTDIIRDLGRKLGFSREKDGPFGSYDTAAMDMGFLFEDALEYALKDRMAIRPEKAWCVDGIWLSPDGVRAGEYNGEPIPVMYLEEYKLTWRSSRSHSVEDDWNWCTQIKAYLYAGAMTKCILRILYVVGDYGIRERKDGSLYAKYGAIPGPDYKEYLIECDQGELDANWKMLVDHARSLGWIE